MRISGIAVALAAAFWSHEASGQSIVQKTDWKAKTLETYLPQPTHSVPWLDLNIRSTKPPKRDWPAGLRAEAVPPFALDCVSTDTRMSSNAVSDLRRM
jgi:hypothetical protein